MTSETKTEYVRIDAELEYAKVFEENRDMGSEKYDLTETEGQYSVVVIVDDKNKKTMVDAGVPEKSMGYGMFKKLDDGRWAYKLKRPHKNKHLDKVIGPPKVFDYNAALADMQADSGTRLNDYVTDWTIQDGLIGNGSRAYVAFTVYTGRGIIVDLQKIGIYQHVPYTSDNDDVPF